MRKKEAIYEHISVLCSFWNHSINQQTPQLNFLQKFQKQIWHTCPFVTCEIWSISPSCCSIITRDMGVPQEAQSHVTCLFFGCTSSCCTVPSCFSGAASASHAPRSQINHRGRLANINTFVSTRLLGGPATSFSITAVLTPNSPEQKQKGNMAQCPHI